MKNTNNYYILLFLLLAYGMQAQQRPELLGHGGGEFKFGAGAHLSGEQRAQMEAQIEENLILLRTAGKLPSTEEKRMVNFDWPLRQATGFSYNSYYAISNFVDHNPGSPNGLLDWNCGTRTSDGFGGNHRGTDISLWPFGWCMMDDEQIEAIAAADGTIIFKQDGNFDRECNPSSRPANTIVLMHTDGSRTTYAHLKNGSLTAKAIGSSVVAGEYLGIVGSSGNSTGPHLHFEVDQGSAASLIDPFGGPCNGLNGNSSRWNAQKPYFETTINTVLTHSNVPQFNACPMPADKFRTDCFEPGDAAYFAVYLHDQQPSQTLNIRVFRPNGTLYVSNSMNFTNYFSASWFWWSYPMPSVPMASDYGLWRFEATLLGNTVSHQFELGNECDRVEIQASTFLQGPLGTSNSIMSTALNSSGLLGLTDPYGLGESVSSMPANIVDWVLVELRDATTPTIVLGQRAGLLRMDGTILDPNDNTDKLKFTGISAATGHVLIKHRNHLGIMTNAPVSF